MANCIHCFTSLPPLLGPSSIVFPIWYEVRELSCDEMIILACMSFAFAHRH
jgi:hypothetical protein